MGAMGSGTIVPINFKSTMRNLSISFFQSLLSGPPLTDDVQPF